MVVLGIVLARLLPTRSPRPGMHYGAILASSLSLLVRTPAIRRRAAYQVLLFATFNLFWTAIPLLLGDRFGLGQIGIALFALAGAGGALAAPLAGRLGDRGYIRAGTAVALVGAMLAMFGADLAAAAHGLILLAAMAVLLDAAVQFNQVLSQRVIYGVAPEARGRVNASYMTCMFIGGAAGSTLSSLTYAHGGWTTTTLSGAALAVLALVLFLTEGWPGARAAA
jgi:predicted MFS family arabinose efflux permease